MPNEETVPSSQTNSEPSTGSAMTRRAMLLSGTALAVGFAFWLPTGKAGTEIAPMMRIDLAKDPANGQWTRSFSGRAAPADVLHDPNTGSAVRVRDLFPNRNDPFAISDRLQLGEGGYRLKTPDRARMGLAPGRNHKSWAMNMIPFGIMLDGSILDPSGPWYDGGPADPNNPFDRACTGWEYEVMHPTVSKLVGVPAAIAGHVQPNGMFHYHGYPRLLISELKKQATERGLGSAPLLAGFSADGFPVLDFSWDEGSGGRQNFRFSGYVLRTGRRQAVPFTNPAMVPPGDFDGLYVQDYVYDPRRKLKEIEEKLDRGESYFGLTRRALQSGRASFSLLDVHNGAKFAGVEGYTGKVYAYVLTPDWPMVPRLFAYEPDDSFKKVIPLEMRREGMVARLAQTFGMGGGRRSLYDQCPAPLKSMREWHGRPPY
jgi:hypothetical protein